MDERICAVVVTCNRRRLLAECLQALALQTRAPNVVVVVDNAGTDGTSEMVQRDFPDVVLIRLEENSGGAGGFYEGMAWALRSGFDWIWVMDDDAEPAPDALAALFACGLHHRPDVAALASLKVGADGVVQAHHHSEFGLPRMRHRPIRPSAGAGAIPVRHASFAGLLVRACAASTAGLPDRDFFILHDDVEYCMRLGRAGRIYLVPESVVVHKDGSEVRPGRDGRAGEGPAWKQYYSHRNRLLTLRRHAPTAWVRRAGYAWGALYLARAVLRALLFQEAKAERLRLCWRAYRDGVRGLSGKTVVPGREQDA